MNMLIIIFGKLVYSTKSHLIPKAGKAFTVATFYI